MGRERWWHLNWQCIPILLGSAAALWGCAWSARNWHRMAQLLERGVPVQARLERKDSRVGRGASYSVYYRFETAEGRSYSGTTTVGQPDSGAWNAAQGQVTVKYLPEDPEVNRWVVGMEEEVGPTRLLTVVLGVIGCLALVIGVLAARMSRERFERWMHWGRSQ
jgi:hypothetical protein